MFRSTKQDEPSRAASPPKKTSSSGFLSLFGIGKDSDTQDEARAPAAVVEPTTKSPARPLNKVAPDVVPPTTKNPRDNFQRANSHPITRLDASAALSSPRAFDPSMSRAAAVDVGSLPPPAPRRASGREGQRQSYTDVATEIPSLRNTVFGSCSHVLTSVIRVLVRLIKTHREYKDDSKLLGPDGMPSQMHADSVRKAKLLYIALLERAQKERGEWQGFGSDASKAAASEPNSEVPPDDASAIGFLTSSLQDTGKDEAFSILTELLELSVRNLRVAVVSPTAYTKHRSDLAALSLACPVSFETLVRIGAFVSELTRDEKSCLLHLVSFWSALCVVNPETHALQRMVEEKHSLVLSESPEMEFVQLAARKTTWSDPLAIDLLIVMATYRDIIFNDLEFYKIRQEMHIAPVVAEPPMQTIETVRSLLSITESEFESIDVVQDDANAHTFEDDDVVEQAKGHDVKTLEAATMAPASPSGGATVPPAAETGASAPALPPASPVQSNVAGDVQRDDSLMVQGDAVPPAQTDTSAQVEKRDATPALDAAGKAEIRRDPLPETKGKATPDAHDAIAEAHRDVSQAPAFAQASSDTLATTTTRSDARRDEEVQHNPVSEVDHDALLITQREAAQGDASQVPVLVQASNEVIASTTALTIENDKGSNALLPGQENASGPTAPFAPPSTASKPVAPNEPVAPSVTAIEPLVPCVPNAPSNTANDPVTSATVNEPVVASESMEPSASLDDSIAVTAPLLASFVAELAAPVDESCVSEAVERASSTALSSPTKPKKSALRRGTPSPPSKTKSVRAAVVSPRLHKVRHYHIHTAPSTTSAPVPKPKPKPETETSVSKNVPTEENVSKQCPAEASISKPNTTDSTLTLVVIGLAAASLGVLATVAFFSLRKSSS